ncbi:YciI family protein [Falsiphaeobacter marinintestinus]|uniref:YciI family protein n=1 Tax=Falsiphaeobacter marinintestinus TaxID=1492905 RepID=UPI0011B84F9C|nr:YciI family protein [Phaeobacter marinintestinus]
MPFVILFQDNPDADPAIRPRHMDAHLAFLEAHAETVVSAGPLTDADGIGAGGIWIVNTPTADAADALVKADPFWPTGLRASYQILSWTQVFADGQRQIRTE